MPAQKDHHSRLASAQDVWLRRPAVDWPIAIVGATVVFLAADPIWSLTGPARSTMYETIATSSAALLGFGVTAIAIFLALVPGARLRHLLRERNVFLNAVFASSVVALALATATGVAGVMTDVGLHANWLRAIVYGVLVLAALRVVRLLWLFTNVVAIATKDKVEGTEKIEDTPTNLRG